MNVRWISGIVIGVIVLGVALSYSLIPPFTRDVYVHSIQDKLQKVPTISDQSVLGEDTSALHRPTPPAVRGIYMSACTAATPWFRNELVKLIDETELNSVMIDIKDYTGMISFTPADPDLARFVSRRCSVPDLKEFIAALHRKDIYVAGRITTFQDPYFASLHPEVAVQMASTNKTWHDRKGLSYLDPGSRLARDHIIAIAKASYDVGFDELNFDYIRYPSDGNMLDISFPHSAGRSKQTVLEDFFKYLHENLKPLGVTLSADLFGMTTTNTDDLNIGQVLERALPYFDYIMPMVYPSHYPPRFNHWQNPNAHPYELISYVMGTAVTRAQATTTPVYSFGAVRVASSTPPLYSKPVWNIEKLRPWIQDFSLGEPRYGAAEVQAEIKAVTDVGLTSWMLWNAGNRYTREALTAE